MADTQAGLQLCQCVCLGGGIMHVAGQILLVRCWCQLLQLHLTVLLAVAPQVSQAFGNELHVLGRWWAAPQRG